jgi:hypothetical protein
LGRSTQPGPRNDNAAGRNAGLRAYGKTLTVLFTDAAVDEDAADDD